MTFSPLVAYGANPLGFKIGEATYDDVRNSMSGVITLNYVGINKYSGGKMLVAETPDLLGYDGLKAVTFIFDRQNVLSAVTIRLARGGGERRNAGFMYAYQQLNKKYLPMFRNLQPVGSMTAGFTTPDRMVRIHMLAKHSSNDFDLQYLSKNFMKRFNMKQSNLSNMTSPRQTVRYNGLLENNNIF